jgi:hypothetical protein
VKTNGAAAAVVLQAPRGREDFATHKTLTIEFMFADRYLLAPKDGRKVRLAPLAITQVIEATGERIRRGDATEPHLVSLCKEDKGWFAYTVVPSLPTEAFQPFGAIFDLIQNAFDEAKKRREAASPTLA